MTDPVHPFRVLTVCLGNICRSPSAEVVLRSLASGAHLPPLEIDSAGTSDWHVGHPPYGPMIKAAAARGYDLTPLRGRQVRVEDFHAFDLILAMDRDNRADLLAMQPPESRAEVALFLSPDGTEPMDVPDPYYTRGFDEALDIIENGAARWIEIIRERTQT